MRKHLYTILITLIGFSANATDVPGLSSNYLNPSFSSPSRYDRPGLDIHFYGTINAGLTSFARTPLAAGDKRKVAGMIGGALGAHVRFGGRKYNNAQMLSVAVGANSLTLEKYDVTAVRIPVYYTFVHNADRFGFYAQVGVDAQFAYLVDRDHENRMSEFNPLFVSPTVGVGLHFPHTISNSRIDIFNGDTQILIGPFYSWCPMDLAKDPAVKLTGHIIGISMTYLYL